MFTMKMLIAIIGGMQKTFFLVRFCLFVILVKTIPFSFSYAPYERQLENDNEQSKVENKKQIFPIIFSMRHTPIFDETSCCFLASMAALVFSHRVM